MLEVAAALAQEAISREGYFEERQAALMPKTSGAPLMPRFCLVSEADRSFPARRVAASEPPGEASLGCPSSALHSVVL